MIATTDKFQTQRYSFYQHLFGTSFSWRLKTTHYRRTKQQKPMSMFICEKLNLNIGTQKLLESCSKFLFGDSYEINMILKKGKTGGGGGGGAPHYQTKEEVLEVTEISKSNKKLSLDQGLLKVLCKHGWGGDWFVTSREREKEREAEKNEHTMNTKRMSDDRLSTKTWTSSG